jgi:hypothetical protein
VTRRKFGSIKTATSDTLKERAIQSRSFFFQMAVESVLLNRSGSKHLPVLVTTPFLFNNFDGLAKHKLLVRVSSPNYKPNIHQSNLLVTA